MRSGLRSRFMARLRPFSMPLVFDSRWRRVTARLAAGSSGSQAVTGASRSSLPWSTSRSTVTAVIHFETEPTMKRVSADSAGVAPGAGAPNWALP
jgi:hypothetical protein